MALLEHFGVIYGDFALGTLVVSFSEELQFLHALSSKLIVNLVYSIYLFGVVFLYFLGLTHNLVENFVLNIFEKFVL